MKHPATHGLDTKQIIPAVIARRRSRRGNPDITGPRIGEVPQNLINAIVEANTTRKDFIAGAILKKLSERRAAAALSPQSSALSPEVIGIHRLVMKAGRTTSARRASRAS